MHISKELSAQNCRRVHYICTSFGGMHPSIYGSTWWIRARRIPSGWWTRVLWSPSAGVGHLGWEDSGLAFNQVAVLKPLVIQSRQGCEEPSDNAGVASALKHQGTQALQGALEAPEPWRLHWLQRNVARGRPQSATQPASQTRIALDSGSLAPSRAQRCITASDDSAAPSRTPQQPPHLSRHRSLFEDKVQH
jgi:hypothetical protein